jgi:hypothetical protein
LFESAGRGAAVIAIGVSVITGLAWYQNAVSAPGLAGVAAGIIAGRAGEAVDGSGVVASSAQGNRGAVNCAIRRVQSIVRLASATGSSAGAVHTKW